MSTLKPEHYLGKSCDKCGKPLSIAAALAKHFSSWVKQSTKDLYNMFDMSKDEIKRLHKEVFQDMERDILINEDRLMLERLRKNPNAFVCYEFPGKFGKFPTTIKELSKYSGLN